MSKTQEALKLALEALEGWGKGFPDNWGDLDTEAVTAIKEALASGANEQTAQVPVTDNTYGYAKSLAETIFKRHFASDEHYASGRIVWGVNDTAIGILTQIDNMVADMVRRPAQQQEPVTLFESFQEFGEGWERLAWELCADEHGEEACNELIWEGGPIPEPWGDRWLKYEGEAKRLIALVHKHTSTPASKPLTDEQIMEMYNEPRSDAEMIEFARAIEAAHGIKGDA